MGEIIDTVFASDTFGNITVWDLKNGTTLINYKSNAINPKCLDILGNDYILAVERGPLINVWPINSQEKLQHMRLVCPGVINVFSISPDNCYIAVALENKLLIWQFATGKLLCTVSGHYQRINIIKWTAESSDIVTGGEDGIVCVWKLSHLISTNYMYLGITSDDTFNSKTDPRYTFSDHSIQITDLCIGSGGYRARLFTASADKSCKIYDLATGTQLLSIVFDTKPTSITVDMAETSVFVGMGNGAIKPFSLLDPPRTREHHVTESTLQSSPAFFGHTKQINCLKLSTDGQHLVSGSADETVKVWHIDSKQCLRTVRMKGNVINLIVRLLPKELQMHEFQPSTVLKSFQKRYDENADGQTLEIHCPRDIRYDDDDLFRSSDDESEQHNNLEDVSELHAKIDELQKINQQLYNFAINKVLDGSDEKTSVSKKSSKKKLLKTASDESVKSFVLKNKKMKGKKKRKK